MRENFEINIAHLYPELLDINSDFGNIQVLKKRLEWRGINVNVDKISHNDAIVYNKFDIYYLGGGQEKQQQTVSELLKAHKNAFKELTENNVVFLGVCGGYQLLGNYYEDKNGNKISGLGLLDSYSIYSQKRFTGNVTVETDFLTPKTIVGFENHTDEIFLENNTKPLGKILVGHGNNSKDNFEGAIYNNCLGTHLHGPVLAQNVHLADFILQLAIRRKVNDNSYLLTQLEDKIEFTAHKNAVIKKY